MNYKFLLLQVRNENDPAKDEEYEAFIHKIENVNFDLQYSKFLWSYKSPFPLTPYSMFILPYFFIICSAFFQLGTFPFLSIRVIP